MVKRLPFREGRVRQELTPRVGLKFNHRRRTSHLSRRSISGRYNRNVLSRFMLVIFLTLGLAACSRSIETKEQVRNDLIDYFSSKVGLDMKTLDVDVTKVSFVNHEAHATVSFHQKDDPSVNRGMVMMYTLAPKDGHWVVKSRADSQGRGFGNSSADQDLPAGHPPVQDLPPGHPSVDSVQPPSPAAAPQEPKK